MDDRALDFSFLQGDFASIGIVPKPVNVFEIAGFPRRETVASNVLAYFLDPNERHGMGALLVDSLLRLLDGAPTFGARGPLPEKRATERDLGSSSWTVTTEEPTADAKRIDVYLSNQELDLAVVIENKIDAAVYNPLASYVKHAARTHTATFSIILSPTRRSLGQVEEMHRGWLSAALTYDDLFDMLQPSIDRPALGADDRSIDLLRQFIQNTSERESRMDAAVEADSLERFWRAIEGNEDAFVEFFRALRRVNGMLKRRAEGLRSEILGRLEPLALVENSFISVGYDYRWGLYEARVAVVYIGFQLVTGATIELVLGFVPGPRRYGLNVKGYRKKEQCLPGYDHEPLGCDYADPDADIAVRFVEVIREFAGHQRAERRPSGSAGGAIVLPSRSRPKRRVQ